MKASFTPEEVNTYFIGMSINITLLSAQIAGES